jgi:hypothetical protein
MSAYAGLGVDREVRKQRTVRFIFLTAVASRGSTTQVSRTFFLSIFFQRC